MIESSLDHIYLSEELSKTMVMQKSEESSSDHLPIITKVKDVDKPKQKDKINYKRSMKNFSDQKWKECLIGKR